MPVENIAFKCLVTVLVFEAEVVHILASIATLKFEREANDLASGQYIRIDLCV